MNNLNSYNPFLKITLRMAFIAITTGARFITNWGSFCYYKLSENLLQQIGAELL